MGGDELRDGITGARVVICNDYEFELIRQKTGMDEADVRAEADALIVTRGEHGSWIYADGGRLEVEALEPSREVDPTGVGDAFRGGLLKGLAGGLDYGAAARIGSVAATYALEHLGATSHSYTLGEFKERFEGRFGTWPG